MSHERFEVPQDERAAVRMAISDMDRQLSSLGSEAEPEKQQLALAALRKSWTGLVELLALGPAPEVRSCPSCGKQGLRAATRCGYCWAELTPPHANGTAG